MFYVVCVYIAIGVLGFIFLPEYIEDKPKEKHSIKPKPKSLEEEIEKIQHQEKWDLHV